MQNKQQTGGKFVYDGKKMQPIYDRYAIDYNPSFVYKKYNQIDSSYVTQKQLDMDSQGFRNSEPPTRFVQLCINKLRSPVSSICWCPDGRRVMSGLGSGEITIWNGVSFNFDTILQAHKTGIKAIQWSRRKNLLLSSDMNGVVKYWSKSLNILNEVEIHKSPIKDISFSFDDSSFCTASDDATIKIVDLITGKVINTLKGHNWDVRKAKFHKELSLIISGGKDNLIKLWDPRTSEALHTFHYHKNTILSAEYFKDDYFVSGGKDQVIKMLDLKNMRDIFTYKGTSDITALTTNDNYIVSGTGLGEINYYEEFNAVHVAKSDKLHENTIWSLDLHPSGHCLASGASDYQVRFWARPRLSRGEKVSEQNEVVEDKVIPGLSFN